MLNDNPTLDRVVYGITPTFGIYQANGHRKIGLKKAFVEILMLTGALNEIRLEDGSLWPIYYEAPINMIQDMCVKHIVSFQVYEDGRFFAVARLYKDKVKV